MDFGLDIVRIIRRFSVILGEGNDSLGKTMESGEAMVV